MSYEIGMQALRLKRPARLAHTEYCDHYSVVRAVTGLDPLKDGSAWARFNDAWDIDLVWSSHDGPINWGHVGRVTDMGHAEFMEGGIDWRDTVACPFKRVEEVLAFDAVEEYGLPEFAELVGFYQRVYREGQARYPGQVFTGGYYKTIVSGAIDAFGWDMLLTAAAEPARFERVLDSFYRYTLHHVKAWAQTSIEVFIQHDDFVWTRGPFMQPGFYRHAILPRYAQLWKVLRDAGKIVLFCSDGNFTEFVDDIVQAGAHGLIFEPLTDLDVIVERYGQTHAIVGSKVDCRTLTFGTMDDVRREVDATLELAMDCPGFMFAVGNHLPSNIPLDNMLFYMDYLRANWSR